jgi:filamentous hemagglutinin family protein
MQLGISFILQAHQQQLPGSSHESRKRPRLRPLALLVPLIAGLACAGAHAAPPLPAGGNFVAGSGSISGGGRTLTIDQTSSRGVIDWNSFSIGNGRTVNINNGTGATLNRVTGTDPSVILGQLNGTGSVYLINPQGVLVGPSGVVATGGRFVASTLDVDNDAFMNGKPLNFTTPGGGSIVNLGRIGSSGGDVILISANSIMNAGSITAPQGTAELATGNAVLLQDSTSSQQVFVQTGSQGMITNSGAIGAAQVSLQAADGNVYALAGNSAAIRATGTANRDGHVWLVADQGTVQANGAISAVNADGTGGTVETRANSLDISDATVQAGHWLIGAPAFTIDGPTAATLARNLSNGTNIDVTANSPLYDSVTVNNSVQWSGAASLGLNATYSVFISPGVTLANTGSGNLTLRADTGGFNNSGKVASQGTIDWSKSTGTVSAYYDVNGGFQPGTLIGNGDWHATQYSGLTQQITAYQLVNTLADLRNVSQNLAGNYALGKDIDASITGSDPNASFTPIGYTLNTPFTGQFDGQGHAVNNFAAGATLVQQYVGLFGVIGSSGVVRNLKVNGSVSGSDPDAYGLIAGRNDGLINNVVTSGSVGVGGFGGLGAGGVAGLNYGTIERAGSSADVGFQIPAGGLVGANYGTIVQSYATGNTSGGSHGSTGGLVAYNNGLITQSYATGGVGGFGGGGLVNYNDSNGVINESFAIGQVGGGGPPGDPEGGIAATNLGAIHNNVYWNRDTTIRTTAAGVNSGTVPPDSNGLTTAQMSNVGNYLDWNIPAGGVWAFPAGATHPVLQWQQGQ